MSTSAEHPPLDKPRVSLNKLGEYYFSTPSEKLKIIKDQKFGNKPKQAYYGGAMHGILGSFRKEDGVFDQPILLSKLQAIASKRGENRNQVAQNGNNAEMLRRFSMLAELAKPPPGDHSVIYQNARIELGGVTVSVRPEIITKRNGGTSVALTKLRFSKSKVSLDASEIILLVLLGYGQNLLAPGSRLDVEETKVIDCYAKTIIAGHQLPAIRSKQLESALAEIARIWPRVHAGSRYSEFF